MEVKLTCPLGYAANNIFVSFLQMPRVQINNTSNQTDRRTESAAQRNLTLYAVFVDGMQYRRFVSKVMSIEIKCGKNIPYFFDVILTCIVVNMWK